MEDKRKDTFKETTVKCKLPLSAQHIQNTAFPHMKGNKSCASVLQSAYPVCSIFSLNCKQKPVKFQALHNFYSGVSPSTNDTKH